MKIEVDTKHFDELTTETKVALDMSGISLGGGDSPLVRLGLRSLKMRVKTNLKRRKQEGKAKI